jgi:formylmethanofuran dehydrogenase subunit B
MIRNQIRQRGQRRHANRGMIHLDITKDNTTKVSRNNAFAISHNRDMSPYLFFDTTTKMLTAAQPHPLAFSRRFTYDRSFQHKLKQSTRNLAVVQRRLPCRFYSDGRGETWIAGEHIRRPASAALREDFAEQTIQPE